MGCILIIDDDHSIVEILTILLEGEGYSVQSALNGDNIKKLLDKSSPALVLLDIWLPGIHGDALLNWMKSEEKYKHIPVILMSASNEAHTVAKVAKADACIDKPFDIDDLISTIKRLIKN